MNVIVSPGFAIVNGCLKLEEAQRTLAIQASSATYDRIDTVVMRLDDNDDARNCDLYVLEGTPALSPVRPELTRSGSVWEIGLADVFVAKNTTTVSNQRITDTRYETSRCGVISSISQFDTTTLYQQVQSDLAEFKDSEQAEFMEWFANLQSQLDENTATNLQNQIGVLEQLKTQVKTSLVNALNWTVDRIGDVSEKIGGTDISKIGDGTVTGAISELNSNLSSIFNKVYPVGSIYMSVSPVNPSSLFGGTWVAWGTGRVPVGINTADADFKTVEKTGGAKINTHNHFTGTGFDGSAMYITSTKDLPTSRTTTTTTVGTVVPSIHPQSTLLRQDSTYTQSISVIQPYITCYMWKRTA